MQKKMHPYQRKNSGSDIVEQDPGALGKLFQLTDWRRLDDIEGSKKYKTRQKSFPREGYGDQRDHLSGDFVNYYELRIFDGRGTRHPGGCRDADCDCQNGQCDGSRDSQPRGQFVRDNGPEQYGCSRGPAAGAGSHAADSEEGGDQNRPERTARAGRPHDGRRQAGAMVASIARGGRRFHSSSSSEELLRIDSSVSAVGDEITYPPLAHFPRSSNRQRSLQKGKSASVLFTAFLQMGQRSLTVRLRGIRLYCKGLLSVKNGLVDVMLRSDIFASWSSLL